MSVEENMALARRFLEAHFKGDLDAMDEMMTPDFVGHTKLLPDQVPTREGQKWAYAQFSAAVSNLSNGRCAQRQGTGLHAHRHPPHGGEQDRRALERGHGPLRTEKTAPRAGDKRARARTAGTQGSEAHPASLPAQGGARTGGLAALSLLPTGQGGRRRLLRFPPPLGRQSGACSGGCHGQGVPAALVMSTTCGMLRLAARSYSSPGEMLQRVNEALFPYIPPNMFVTCFYCILDPESGSLTYANAGHDLLYLHRNGEAEELRARGMPLGLMPGMSYEEKEIVLDAGQSALFYTDGLVEAHDPKGEMFGFPRLRAFVAEHGEERSLGDFLLEQLYSFTGEEWEQEDDITLLTLRRSSSLS